MQKTFKRYEKKYMLDERQYKQISDKLKQHMDEDAYGNYSIRNLYFDTDNFEIIRRSAEKPIYKEKLRVRCYGTPESCDTVFLELKKKYRSEVYKRRISITLAEYEDFIIRGVKPGRSEQILNEIEYFLKLYRLYPRIYIAYDRTAFTGKDDKSLRVTFDKNIRFRNSELSLKSDDKVTKILPDDHYIMEIKAPGAMPMWLCDILNELRIFPQSFSKYGYCYQNYLKSALA